MVVEINLLPNDRGVDKGTLKLSGALNKLALGLTVLFLLITAIGGGIYFFTSQRLNSVKADEELYTTNIQNLQSTEASLILLKDRIQKAQNILSMRTAEDALKKHQNVLAFESPDITFQTSQVDESESSFEITSGNSSALAAFVGNILIQSNLAALIIEEFSFNPTIGYGVRFQIR